MDIIKRYTFPVLFLTVVVLNLIDGYKNPNTVYTYLSIPSGSLLFALFSIIIIFRMVNKILLSKRTSAFLIGAGFIFFLITSILAYINYYTYANYIYGKTLINIDRMYILSLFLLFSGIIFQSNVFFKKNYKVLLFLTTPLLLYSYYWFGFFPLDVRHQIAKEDHLIENFQFVVLFLSGILSLLLSKRFFIKHLFLGLLFLVVASSLFLIAGDEISWGQRILHISTPQIIIKENVQGEITLHNTRSLQGVTPFLFMLVGLYGSVMFAVYRLLKKLKNIKHFYVIIPPGFLFPFFFTGFFYNFYTSLGPHQIGAWSEPTELILYLGVFFYLLVLFKKPPKM